MAATEASLPTGKPPRRVRLDEETARELAHARPAGPGVPARGFVVWRVDPWGRMRGDNPGWLALTGQHGKAAQGSGWFHAVAPEDAHRVHELLLAHRARPRDVALGMRARDPRGRLVPLEGSIVPVLDGLGKLVAWVFAMREAGDAESGAPATAIAQRVDALQMVVDIVGHDLRNHLCIVEGAIEAYVLQHPDAAEPLALAGESLSRMARILENALLLRRLGATSRLERGAHDVMPLVRNAVDEVQPLADRHEVGLALDAPAGLRALVHPILERAIANLLANAVQWSPHGESVRIGLHASAGGIEVTVADHGPGIPTQEREGLFRRFGASGRSDGLGLGLAITARIVALHEGSIAVETTPGGGATFRVRLPSH